MLSKIFNPRIAFIISAFLMGTGLTTASWGMEIADEDTIRADILISSCAELESVKAIAKKQDIHSLGIQPSSADMDWDTSFSFKILFQLFPNLEVLDIDHFSMGCSPYGKERMKELCAVLKQKRPLKKLILTQCNIYNDGARLLAKALLENSTLEELYVHHNHIRNTPTDKYKDEFESTLATKSKIKVLGLDTQKEQHDYSPLFRSRDFREQEKSI